MTRLALLRTLAEAHTTIPELITVSPLFPAPRTRVAALALSVGLVGMLPAAATYAEDGPVAAPPTQADPAATPEAPSPEEAVDNAAELLLDDQPAAPPSSGRTQDPEATAVTGERVDATLALRDVLAARPSLSGQDADLADELLARPSDGARDPYGDGYRARSQKRCTGNICVHYVTSTSDRATPAFVRTTLNTLTQVWRYEIGRLRYDRPPGDGKRGGNAKFDVYLSELGNRNLFGYCAPERRSGARAASSFCVLDNDFARSQYGRAPIESLRVTAAHEFFHAVQFGYDYLEDKWLQETTATWMEERFADSVDDNRRYLRYGQMSNAGGSLDVFSPSGFNHYGNWAFWEYLSQRFGNQVVRQTWQRTSRGSTYSAQALRQTLGSRGGLARVFAAYAAGNNVPGRTYSEGAAWPTPRVAGSRSLGGRKGRVIWNARADHLASKTLRLAPTTVLPGRKLRIRVAGPAGATTPAAALVVVRKNGSLVRRAIPLDAQGDGATTLGFSTRSTRRVFVTVANVSTRFECRTGTSFSCEGDPVDQAQRFAVSAQIRR